MIKKILIITIGVILFALPTLTWAEDHDCGSTYSTCSDYGSEDLPCKDGNKCLGAVDWCYSTFCGGVECPQCNNACGCTRPSPPACTPCTPAACPDVINGPEDDNYKLENFTTCYACNKSEFRHCYEIPNNFPNISVQRISDGSTSLGYTHLGYTGKELNNPYRFKVTVTDIDGQSDVESFSLWFTDTTLPTTPDKYSDILAGYPRSYSNTSFGVMYRKEGVNWKPYNATYTTSPSTWIKSPVGTLSNTDIFDSNGTAIGQIKGTFNSILNGYEFILDIYPTVNNNSMVEDSYNIFAQANDKFTFTPYDNYPELETLDPAIYRNIRDYFAPYKIRVSNNWIDTGVDWVVDLTDPVIESFTTSARGSSYPSEVQLSLHLTDNLDISKVVINAFASGNLVIDSVSYGGKSFTPDRVGTTTYTGIIGHEKSFLIDYPGNPLAPDSQNSNIYINIGDNKAGSIYFHATLFDSAGNIYQQQQGFDLEDWMITQGNFVYSSNGIDFDTKTVPAGTWSSVPELNRFLPDRADISTEMYSDGLSTATNKLINADVNQSYYISNLDTSKSLTNYDNLVRALQNRLPRVSDLQDIPLGANLTGNLCITNCTNRIHYLHTEGDLNVNAFQCNGKGIITVGGNLIIQPDILNSNANRDACVFLVHGNVNIGSGTYHSTSSLRYDQVNAFIIADGRITLESDQGVSGSRKDGLKINGSLISFNPQPILFERFLRLADKQYYPAVVLESNEKYTTLLKLAFGSRTEIMKTEVGVKPF
jgi:hypothetical protein